MNGIRLETWSASHLYGTRTESFASIESHIRHIIPTNSLPFSLSLRCVSHRSNPTNVLLTLNVMNFSHECRQSFPRRGILWALCSSSNLLFCETSYSFKLILIRKKSSIFECIDDRNHSWNTDKPTGSALNLASSLISHFKALPLINSDFYS